MKTFIANIDIDGVLLSFYKEAGAVIIEKATTSTPTSSPTGAPLVTEGFTTVAPTGVPEWENKPKAKNGSGGGVASLRTETKNN